MTDKVSWTKDYLDAGLSPLTERQLMPNSAPLTGPRSPTLAVVGYYNWIYYWQQGVNGPSVPPALGY